MKRVFSIAIALFLLLSVAACSLATVAYNNADMLITYNVDDYFDLSGAQEEWLRARINKHMAWHRANELPQVRRVIEDARVRVDDGLTMAEIENGYANGRAMYLRVAEQMLPDIAEFLLLLEPQQIRFVEEKLASDNEKVAKEARGDEVKLKQKRVRRFEEQFKDWMGDLTAAQLAEINSAVSAMKPLDDLRLANRRAKQAEFIALLRAKPDSAAMQKALRPMLLQPELKRAPDYRSELEQQQRAIMELVARISVTATPLQKARVQARLLGYEKDIAILLSGA
jgi:hypothetical protein